MVQIEAEAVYGRRQWPGRHRRPGPPRLRASSPSERLQELIELFVALCHAALHARRQQAVAGLDGRTDRPAAQPAAAAAEVLKPDELDVHHVRRALEFEGLDDEFVLPHLVVHAVELELAAIGLVRIAVAAAGLEVPMLDGHLEVTRSEPLLDQVGLGVSPKQRLHWSVEVPGQLHGQGVYGGGEVERVRHFSVPSLVSLVSLVSEIRANRASNWR